MTEERIKELAHTWAWKPIAVSIAGHEENLSTLIRTVAAEAREEGIEDFADALAEKFGPYSVILELAERVKEKGK